MLIHYFSTVIQTTVMLSNILVINHRIFVYASVVLVKFY